MVLYSHLLTSYPAQEYCFSSLAWISGFRSVCPERQLSFGCDWQRDALETHKCQFNLSECYVVLSNFGISDKEMLAGLHQSRAAIDHIIQ